MKKLFSIILLVSLSGCAFLGSNKTTANAATPIHIRPSATGGWIGDTYAHDNWIQLCKTHGADAHPANPDPASGWSDLGNAAITVKGDVYGWAISQEAYDQYFSMDQAALANPGLYMPSK